MTGLIRIQFTGGVKNRKMYALPLQEMTLDP